MNTGAEARASFAALRCPFDFPSASRGLRQNRAGGLSAALPPYCRAWKDSTDNLMREKWQGWVGPRLRDRSRRSPQLCRFPVADPLMMERNGFEPWKVSRRTAKWP